MFVAGQPSGGGDKAYRKHTYVLKITGQSPSHYYRLKMVDADGAFGYSPIESVAFEQDRTVYLYPNPSRKGTLNWK